MTATKRTRPLRPVATGLLLLMLTATALAQRPPWWRRPRQGQQQPPQSQQPLKPGELIPIKTFGGRTATTQPADLSREITFNFQDATLDQVLSFLARASGMTVVSEVQAQGSITIVNMEKVSVM